MTPRARNAILAGILAAALAIRLAFFLSVQHLDLVTVPLLDGQSYHAWAQRLLAGNWDWYHTWWLAPLYPHLLALLYLVTGPQPAAMVAVQLVLNLLDVFLVWRLAAGALGRNDGRPLLAAALFAGYGPAVFYTSQLLAATVLTTLALGIAGQAWRVQVRPTLPGLAGLGALLGLAAVGRGNFLVVAGALLVFVMARGVGNLPRWRAAAVLTAGILVMVLPVTLRNMVVAGDTTLLTSNAGLNLLIGQQADYRGLFAHVSGEAEAEFDPSRERVLETAAGRALTGSDVSGNLTRRALALFWQERAAMPAHYLRKAYRFWCGYELPQIVSYDFWRVRLPALRWLPVPFLVLGALGLAGLGGLPRPLRLILVWLVVFYFLSLWPFFPTARYRLPIVPLLAIPTADLAWRLLRRQPGVLRPALTAVVLVIVLWPAWGALDSAEVAWQAHLHNGARAARRGDGATVISEGQRAEAVRPRLAETPYQVARQLEETGDPSAAVARLQVAATRAPSQKIIPYRLGRDLEQLGDAEAALEAYARAAALDTTWHLPHLRSGLLLRRLGRRKEAEISLRRAAALEPGDRRVRANLASLLAETGRLAEARRLLEQLVRDEPHYVNGWFNLALVAWNGGDANAARTALARAASLKNLEPAQRDRVDRLGQAMDSTAAHP